MERRTEEDVALAGTRRQIMAEFPRDCGTDDFRGRLRDICDEFSKARSSLPSRRLQMGSVPCRSANVPVRGLSVQRRHGQRDTERSITISFDSWPCATPDSGCDSICHMSGDRSFVDIDQAIKGKQHASQMDAKYSTLAYTDVACKPVG